MDNIFTNIFEFVVNKTHNGYHKALFFLSAIIILVVLDNTLNFTSSYNNIRRYEQMQAINSIISDTTLSISDRKILKQYRSSILIHKTWKDKTYQFFNSIDFNFSKQNNDVIPSNNVPIEDPRYPEVKPVEKEKVGNNQRNYWLHFVTSSWTIVLCMLFLPFIPFFTKQADIKGAILVIPIFELFFYILAWTFAKLLSFIPIVLNNVNYNYALNFLTHIAIIFVLGYITNKYQKRRKS